MKCSICNSEFTPEPNQEKAYWAVTWNSMGGGLLCVSCHSAAKKLYAVGEKAKEYLGVLPWKSEIKELAEQAASAVPQS